MRVLSTGQRCAIMHKALLHIKETAQEMISTMPENHHTEFQGLDTCLFGIIELVNIALSPELDNSKLITAQPKEH